MTECTYCKAPIDRNIFCCASHKVMYHRKNPRKDNTYKQELDELQARWDMLDIALQHKLKLSADEIINELQSV